MKLGDAIASMATPIARGLGLPCIDPVTQELRPESRCNKWIGGLNDFSDAIYDRFWQNNNNKNEVNTMEEIMFQIVIAVKANSVEEALAKYKTEGNALSVNPRPQPAQRSPIVAGQPVRPQ